MHIYHLEKIDSNIKGFFQGYCLPAIQEVLKKLGCPRVIGFSGLCVTQDSICLFLNKLKCVEEPSYNGEEEHIVKCRE